MVIGDDSQLITLSNSGFRVRRWHLSLRSGCKMGLSKCKMFFAVGVVSEERS